jgi:hypothetical protein
VTSSIPGVLLHITAAQLDALDMHAERRFVERLVDSREGAQVVVDAQRDDMRARYRAWLSEGRALGFTTEYELAVFVRCCECLGSDFPRRAELEAAAVVAAPAMSSARKARRLEELCALTDAGGDHGQR